MKLEANLDVVNNLANKKGFKKSAPCFSQLSFCKDTASNKYYLIVNSTKKPSADKYRLANNVEKIHCKFVQEGKATIVLKEPNFTLALNKANVNQLKVFLKLVHLASNSQNIGDELNKLQTSVINSSKSSLSTHNVLNERSTSNQQQQLQQSQPIKKPAQHLIIKSRSEYLANFKSIITQNLKIRTRIGESIPLLNLTKLVINSCDLKHIDKAIFELDALTTLDLSMNKLTEINDFAFRHLSELNLSNNEIRRVGANVRLPKLCILDLSLNQMCVVDKHFCMNFKSLKCLKLNSNRIRSIYDGFGCYLTSLSNFYANQNELNSLPFSCSYLRLEMLELHENPFEYQIIVPNLNLNHRKFPTLVEICARFVVNTRMKYAANELPRTLCDYLFKHYKCICGRVCFEYNFQMTSMFDLNRMAKSFTYLTLNGVSDNQVPLKMYLCSWSCYRKNCKLKAFG